MIVAIKSTMLPPLEHVKMVTYGLSIKMLKFLKLSLTISITLILFIWYFIKEAHDGIIDVGLSWSQWTLPGE